MCTNEKGPAATGPEETQSDQLITVPQAGQVALSTLAERINAEHHQAEAALNDGLNHAVEAGRFLLEAKSQVDHGEWSAWLDANFDGSQRTARAYMLVAVRLPELERQNGNGVANLSFRQALRLTAPPQTKIRNPERRQLPFLDLPLERRKRLFVDWDMRAAYVLLLDAAGWTSAKIAEALGVSIDQVAAILNPRPPRYHFGDFPEIFKLSYVAAVSSWIGWHLERAYSKAVFFAARDGFSHLVPILEASVEAKYAALAARCRGLDGWLMELSASLAPADADRANWSASVKCCAADDMREALGIQAREFVADDFRTIVSQWREAIQTDEVKGAMEAAAA